MQSYYAARAPEYDRIYLKPERQNDLRHMESWLTHAFDGRSVLEIACGTGYWTQFFAPHAARVVALDSASETLQIARQRVPASKVEFLLGDAYAIPEQSPRPDAAFAGFWFSHVAKKDIPNFLQGLSKSLQPGSKVIMIDNLYVEGSSTPVSERDGEGNTYQARKLDDGSTHRVLKNFPTADELMDMLGAVGTQARYRAWQHYWGLEYVTL